MVYAVHTANEIDVFDANTFLSLGTILGAGQASELTVDSTGRHLSLATLMRSGFHRYARL